MTVFKSTLWLAAVSVPLPAYANCPSPSDVRSVVLRDMAEFFAAAKAGDRSNWRRLTSSDLLVHERGKKYNRDTFFDLIQSMRAKGIAPEWSVTEPRIESGCSIATLAYVNRGAIVRAGVRTPASWLETANFRYVNDRWVITFISSMRTEETELALQAHNTKR